MFYIYRIKIIAYRFRKIYRSYGVLYDAAEEVFSNLLFDALCRHRFRLKTTIHLQLCCELLHHTARFSYAIWDGVGADRYNLSSYSHTTILPDPAMTWPGNFEVWDSDRSCYSKLYDTCLNLHGPAWTTDSPKLPEDKLLPPSPHLRLHDRAQIVRVVQTHSRAQTPCVIPLLI